MANLHDLHGRALAAVGDAPEPELLGPGDGVAGSPKIGGSARVDGVAQKPRPFAVLDLPRHLAAELKVEAEVVDAPALVGLEQDAVARVGNEVLERALARFERDVDHADERDAGVT